MVCSFTFPSRSWRRGLMRSSKANSRSASVTSGYEYRSSCSPVGFESIYLISYFFLIIILKSLNSSTCGHYPETGVDNFAGWCCKQFDAGADLSATYRDDYVLAYQSGQTELVFVERHGNHVLRYSRICVRYVFEPSRAIES